MVTRQEVEQVRADISKVADMLALMQNERLDASSAELLLSRKKF
jgi:hypothetical protein